MGAGPGPIAPGPLRSVTLTNGQTPARSKRASGSLESGPVPHQQPSYKGLEKRALRVLNGLLTFYYGTLNFGCYDGDGAPGGGLSMRKYSLPRVTEGGLKYPLPTE